MNGIDTPSWFRQRVRQSILLRPAGAPSARDVVIARIACIVAVLLVDRVLTHVGTGWVLQMLGIGLGMVGAILGGDRLAQDIQEARALLASARTVCAQGTRDVLASCSAHERLIYIDATQRPGTAQHTGAG